MNTPSLRTLALTLPILMGPAATLLAAEDTTPPANQLEEVTVTATRVEKSALRVPAAVSAVGEDEVKSGRQGLGLDESLGVVPGLFFQDRYNFAQDLRISIRGFGARSNFGIRGVRIYADGVPLTLPDGQSNIDEIDLGSLSRIEVSRGASSALYGSAAGGVINLYSEDGPAEPFVSTQIQHGSYNQQNYQLKTGGQYGDLNYSLNLNRLSLDGFREQSELVSNLLNTKLRYDLTDDSSLTMAINVVNQPTSEDPGALTLAEVNGTATQAACRARGYGNPDGREAASCRNVAFNGGESVDQQRVSFAYRKRFGEKHELLLRNYYTWRDFVNQLVPAGGGLLGNAPSVNGTSNSAWVEFDRFFLGGGAQYSYTDAFFGHRNRLTIGVDVDSQRDDRQRYDNDLGRRGNLTFDQVEQVDSRGYYLQNEFAITDTVELTFGARYDKISYEVDDSFLTDVTGDDSDDEVFERVNPSAGISWAPLESLNLYANIATGFETPSTTEFANPVANGTAGGLNSGIKPQTSTSYEIGFKGLVNGRSLSYDLAVFHIDTENEFVNVALTGAPLGRTFLENARRTTRDGLEAAIAWEPRFIPGMRFNGAYTYSDFEYAEFTGALGPTAGTNFEGKDLPGVPMHQFYGQVSYVSESGMTIAWDLLRVGNFSANNSNTVVNESYKVANLRATRPFDLGDFVVTPFVGVNNMFDSEYNGNVRLNQDANGRFFEPAPQRNAYGGLTVRYDY